MLNVGIGTWFGLFSFSNIPYGILTDRHIYFPLTLSIYTAVLDKKPLFYLKLIFLYFKNNVLYF